MILLLGAFFLQESLWDNQKACSFCKNYREIVQKCVPLNNVAIEVR